MGIFRKVVEVRKGEEGERKEGYLRDMKDLSNGDGEKQMIKWTDRRKLTYGRRHEN